MNAIYALKTAIGELQKYAGPDQRVTTRADIDSVDATGNIPNPYWTAVWRQSSTSASRSPELLTWLVSGNEESLSVLPTDTLPAPSANGSSSIWLVGDGTVNDSAKQVMVLKKSITSPQNQTVGHYAWWIGDEGMKANIGLTDPLDSRPKDERIYSFMGVQRTGGELIEAMGSSYRPNNSELQKTIALTQLPLTADDSNAQSQLTTASKTLFHDVTFSSTGLLTNTADGGLKKDLSAWLRGTTASSAPDDDDFIAAPVGNDTYGLPRWGLIRSFTDTNGDQASASPVRQTDTTHGIFPVITYSYLGVAPSSDGNGANFRVQLFPLVALWNPFSIPIAATDFEIGIGAFSNDKAQLDFYQIDTTGPDSDSTSTASYNYIATLHLNSGKLDDDQSNNNSDGLEHLFRFTVRAPEIPPGASLLFGLADSEDGAAYSPGQNVLVSDGSSPTLNSVTITSNIPVSYDPDKPQQQSIFYRWEPANLGTGGRHNVALRVKPEINDDPTGVDFGTDTLHAVHSIGFSSPNSEKYSAWTTYALEPQWRVRSIMAMEYTGIYVPWLALQNFSAPESSRSPRDTGHNTSHIGSMGFTNFSGEPITALGPGDGYDNWRMSAGNHIDCQEGTATEVILREFLPDGVPFFSIGQLSHVNLSPLDIYPTWAVGNSLASYRVALTATSDTERYFNPSPMNRVYDLSYLLNEALWNKYFFSTIPGDTTQDQINDGIEFPNTRMRLQGKPLLDDLTSEQYAFDRAAEHLTVSGAFNVNSTSVEAWSAVLSGMNGMNYNPATGGTDVTLETPYTRYFVPDATPNAAWSRTYRTLSDEQIQALAEGIVEEVKARGPFLSMSDFVNRRLEESRYGLKGPIQAAIDQQSATAATGVKINEDDAFAGSSGSGAPSSRYYLPQLQGGSSDYGYEAQTPWKSRRAFAPGYLTQADVLSAIGSCLTARSDTFIVRAYGDVVGALSGKVESQAWCEAIVQRVPDYVDTTLSPWETPPANSDAERFGRSFRIVSMRWLTPDEI